MKITTFNVNSINGRLAAIPALARRIQARCRARPKIVNKAESAASRTINWRIFPELVFDETSVGGRLRMVAELIYFSASR
jgi:hypothetical protein